MATLEQSPALIFSKSVSVAENDPPASGEVNFGEDQLGPTPSQNGTVSEAARPEAMTTGDGTGPH